MQVVLIGHSWGDNVSRFALATIEADHLGWCEAHIRAQINIAGPTLGAPKALTPTLSGEQHSSLNITVHALHW